MTPSELEALRLIGRVREMAAFERRPVSTVLKEALVQLDLLDGDIPPDVKAFVQFFYADGEFLQAIGRDRLAKRLERIMASVEDLSGPQLFRDAPSIAIAEIIRNAEKDLGSGYGGEVDGARPGDAPGSRGDRGQTGEATGRQDRGRDFFGAGDADGAGGQEGLEAPPTEEEIDQPFDPGRPFHSLGVAAVGPEYRRVGLPDAHEIIWAHTGTTKLRDHPDYEKAKKNGDWDAAERVVNDLVPVHMIDTLQARFGTDVIYLGIGKAYETSKNRLPVALAHYLAGATGADVTTDIVQAASIKGHTGADALDRVIFRSRFDGPVVRGARYVLVDDVATMGSTASDLAGYIRERGGEIAGFAVLGNHARNSANIAASPAQIARIEKVFGHVVREELGIEPTALTEGEARAIFGSKDADALRDRIRARRGDASRTADLRADQGEDGGQSQSAGLNESKAGFEEGGQAAYQSPDIEKGFEQRNREFRSNLPDRAIDELYEVAPRWQDELAGVCSEITDRLDVEWKNPGFKKKETTAQKMERKRYRTTAQLSDVVRGGFLVKTPAEADEIARTLGEHFQVLDQGWVLPRSITPIAKSL